MEVVKPRIMFVDPLGYEVTKSKIDEYAKKILEKNIDDDNERWGTAGERFKEAQQLQISKSAKRKVENVVKKMLKETKMTKELYIEAKQTAAEVKASGQRNILLVQPLSIAPATSPPQPPEAQPVEEEDVTVISELSTPALTRRSTRTSPSVTLAPAKQEKDEKKEGVTPKRSKRIKEIVIVARPKKKPKVLMIYVGKKTTKEKEKETPPKKMRGQIASHHLNIVNYSSSDKEENKKRQQDYQCVQTGITKRDVIDDLFCGHKT